MADPEDLMKRAGGFFSKLGGQLKQTTKQVTGLGRGSVRLELDATKAAPGAALRGRIVLALAEPIEAKRLVVTLRARQKVMNVHRSDSGRSVSTSHAGVYEHDVELGGAKSYESGAFAFELTVPPDALDLQPSAGANPLADAVRTVASALSPSAGPVEWQVIGKLVIPWGRDLSHEVDVVVAR
ncbi:MAG TPA: hypothetical protein VLX92_25715 [Kofleriaceae bacterium]|nr:hypothetical protein [Kofleriaceae bacterium]